MTPREFLLNLRYAFRPRKPLLLMRLAEAVLRSMVLRQMRLRYVDFAVDFACNLRCAHCFATALQNDRRPRMSPADYRRVAEQAMALGAVNFSFQGGEPLLFADLDAVIGACAPERNLISVTTNGTLLTLENLRRLRQTGVDILTVSLDSAVAEEHDRFRGAKGAFAKALAGIKQAQAMGFCVTLGTVVTHQNLRTPGIAALARLAQELRCLLYFILPVAAGRWTQEREMSLTPDDLALLETWTRSSPYLRTDFQANLYSYGCGAAKEILYLTPYGDVLVCPFIHIAFGNILHEPLAAIRQRALAIPYFAHYHKKCLAASDGEFISRHLSRTWTARQLPLAAEEVFAQSTSEAPQAPPS